MYPRPYGNYVLLERLGSGGMSEVDLARRTVEEAGFVRFVVIKRIKTDRSTDPSFVRMFKDEARITAELHHAHIGQVYDFGRHEDEWYLALEYVPGVDVRYLVNALRERGQRVPVKVALRILCDTLDALEYAHTKADTLGRPMHIVHRDVNPRNIMVSIRGDVKLIDFGVAKATDRLERTRTDHIKGKFAYMAPEQITGAAVDRRADLYAAGLCLHELLAGVSPFFGLNQMQILHRMMSARVPPMPSVPELPYPDGLARVHDAALQARPEDRYQDARAFREDLEAVAKQIGGLPSREQVARFVAQIDPELVERLQAKMEAWSSLELSSSEPTDRIEDPARRRASDRSSGAPAGTGSGTLSRSVIVPGEEPLLPERTGDLPPLARRSTIDATGPSISRTGIFAGGILVASIGSALLGGIVATALTVAALWWWTSTPETTVAATGPVQPPTAEQPGEVAPAPPAPVNTPEEALSTADRASADEDPPTTKRAAPPPETAPTPSATADPEPAPTSRPASAPSGGTPSPEPSPSPSAAPEPAPPAIPDPATAAIQPPEPAVAAPAPEPAALGTLRVNAATRGLRVYLDGQPTEHVTPVELTLPVGAYEVTVEGFAPREVTVKEGRPTFAQFR